MCRDLFFEKKLSKPRFGGENFFFLEKKVVPRKLDGEKFLFLKKKLSKEDLVVCGK